jgi:hypothetical protein
MIDKISGRTSSFLSKHDSQNTPGILTDEVLPGILTDEVLPGILTDEARPGILTLMFTEK